MEREKIFEILKHQCIGCGICGEELPDLIHYDGFSAYPDEKLLRLLEEDELLLARVKKIVESCPAEAMKLRK